MAKKIPQQQNNRTPVHNPTDGWPGPTGPNQPKPRVGGQPEANLIDNAPTLSLKQALANADAQVQKAKGSNWKGS